MASTEIPSSEGKLTKSDLDELVKYLRPVKEKWREIGQDLGLSREDLDSISNCDQVEEENLRSVLKLWLKNADTGATWMALYHIIEQKLEGGKEVAETILQEKGKL